jgi:glycosyltransferase involved in cell wall biosynthesis
MLNKKNITISCIIPAYNEEKNIGRVLEVVTKYNKFDEIIIVNDGSKDNTTQIVTNFKKRNKKIILLENKINLGKTAGVKKGILFSKSNLIVLLDADLIDLQINNIDDLIEPVISGDVSQTILDRAGDRIPIWGWTNCARFFGGERCFWKSDFLDVQIPESGGYLLEIIMNLHNIHRNKLIRTIYCSNLYTVHQYNKVNKFKGVWNYLKMSYDIVKKSTITGFLKQVVWIESDRYTIIYKGYRKWYFLRLLDGVLSFIWLNIKPLFLFLEGWSLKPMYYVKEIKKWWLTR